MSALKVIIALILWGTDETPRHSKYVNYDDASDKALPSARAIGVLPVNWAKK